ncbi:DUF732 domain-containing protein [Streptomyces sp. SID161]|nr:DUF732 domain-containing protein [Streptomyces sp. SID161]
MRRRNTLAAGVFLLLASAGCSTAASDSGPSGPTSQLPSKDAVLREALQDPGNVDRAAWASFTASEVGRGARAVCSDLSTPGNPPATVWRHVMDRFGVAMSDADYFTRASAKLYCPRYQREAGYLS